MAKKASPKKKRSDTSMGLIIGLGMALGLGAFFFNNYAGEQLTILGFIAWAAIFGTAVAAGLLSYTRFILPLPVEDTWGEAYLLILRYLREGASPPPPPPEETQQEKRRRRRREKEAENPRKPPDPNRLPVSFKTLKAGVTKSFQVLALSRGNSFSRAAGSVLVILEPGERVTDVIDLRPHERKKRIKAHTRDSIPVEAEITLVFCVKQVETNDTQRLYPFDRDAIFPVSYAHSLDPEKGEMHWWQDQVIPHATSIFVNELARHTLDDLYPADGNPHDYVPLEEVSYQVRRKLNDVLLESGIQVQEMQISHLHLPEEVIAQRIRTWQATWQRRIQEQQAKSNAELLALTSQARARAQTRLIEKLTEQMEAINKTEQGDLPELMRLRLIEALEESASQGETAVPPQVWNLLVDGSNDV